MHSFARFPRSRVDESFVISYIPGWDCHGLPIENKALQELGVRAAFFWFEIVPLISSEKKDSLTLPANVIRSTAHSTATKSVASQKEQFRQLGIMADWNDNSTYRTLGTQNTRPPYKSI